MTTSPDFLWYIPNDVKAGHRGDTAADDHNSLDTLTAQAQAIEGHGWRGALIGTGWSRPDTFTVATALAACTTAFAPLIAVRPGYWNPANFASAAATLDHLSGGRVRVNVVSGRDELAAYGDHEADQSTRYARTKEFMRLVRRLWTEENVTFAGNHFRVSDSTVMRGSTVETVTLTPSFILAALPQRPNMWPPRKPMCSSSGANLWMACVNASTGWTR